MYDLTIGLDDRPGALAEMGEALGAAGVSVEGGGAWTVDGRGVAHFLFHDGEAATAALERAGIKIIACRKVVARRLHQDKPGQLGAITQALATAGVNIEVLYSDHDHRLILVTDDPDTAATATAGWNR
ncbi:amino acid-binding protein [Actinoallomurus sp. NPDC050550]|uniref:amino acid-binding protein n=1 Tax=Actinoallomurus sp. NPDC050550 TaxID=3154937 RepID=UPI0033C31E22